MTAPLSKYVSPTVSPCILLLPAPQSMSGQSNVQKPSQVHTGSCRQHDAAAFLRVGAQNDAVEALELLAAAAEHEMRLVQRCSSGDPRAPNGDRASGLAFAARLGSEDGGDMHATMARIVVPVCAADGCVEDPREGSAGSASSGSALPAAVSHAEEHEVAELQCAEGSRAELSDCADQRNAAAVEDSETGSLSHGVSANGPKLSGGNEATAAPRSHATEADPKTSKATTTASIANSSHRMEDAGNSVAAMIACRESEAQVRDSWQSTMRLPLQGLQAHELVCSSCRTPYETQLAPFYVLSLGASMMTVCNFFKSLRL